jgi:hypothetical protein
VYVCCVTCCDGCLFGLFLLAPLLSQGCCRVVFGLGGVLWFCVVCVVGSALCCFLRGGGVMCVLVVWFFWEQPSGARAVVVGWLGVGGCFRGSVQAPRLVAAARLPADAARLTHVRCLLKRLSSHGL